MMVIPLPDVYWGEVTAEKNGEEWEANIYGVIDKPYKQGIDIIIRRHNEKGFLREDLFFFKIPDKLGKYPIEITDVRTIDNLTGANYGTSLDDGDVAGDFFELMTGQSDNFIEIDKKEGKEIWGNFQVSFIKDLKYGESDPSAPDTIVFKSGKFHTKIEE